jgi:hypothetical protein
MPELQLPLPTVENAILPGFEIRSPTHQNSLDIVPGGWLASFPASSGLLGGLAPTFEDPRVPWASSILGGLNGRSILELGPFEAYNTYQFHQAGAGPIVSIESNRFNFIKCLIIKNIFGLNATFVLGDFHRYINDTMCRFDICWASGVLYHMIEPIELLYEIRKVSDTTFIWSHYFDHEHIEKTVNMSYFDSSKDLIRQVFGRSVCLHHRNYQHPDDKAPPLFSGGAEQYSYWMEKDDILFILNNLGYARIDLGRDEPTYAPGPAFCLVART